MVSKLKFFHTLNTYSVVSCAPLVNRFRAAQVDFLQHLEMFMRTERAPLAGREHIMFRSFYQPVSNTIDGDLCEQSRQGTAAGRTRSSMETYSQRKQERHGPSVASPSSNAF